MRMENSDWLETWKENHIPFHQDVISSFLLKHFPSLEIPPSSEVFVPLCGKSLDLNWFLKKGYVVKAVELSSVAIESFFKENRIELLSKKQTENFIVWKAKDLEIWEGDFFDFPPAELSSVRAVWDVAALVALSGKCRSQYAQKMIRQLPDGVSYLLLSLEFDQRKLEGPPFSLPEYELAELFNERFQIRQLDSMDGLRPDSPLREKGLESAQKRLFLMMDKA